MDYNVDSCNVCLCNYREVRTPHRLMRVIYVVAVDLVQNTMFFSKNRTVFRSILHISFTIKTLPLLPRQYDCLYIFFFFGWVSGGSHGVWWNYVLCMVRAILVLRKCRRVVCNNQHHNLLFSASEFARWTVQNRVNGGMILQPLLVPFDVFCVVELNVILSTSIQPVYPTLILNSANWIFFVFVQKDLIPKFAL